MGQRTRIVTEIWGFRGWKVREVLFEDGAGGRVKPLASHDLHPEVRVVLRVERTWAPRCSGCGAICRRGAHEKLRARRWADLPWAGRPVQIEAHPIRVKCPRCRCSHVEMLAWAEPRQHQSRRLQQHIALDAASMPLIHVAAKYGLTWGVVRRSEGAALTRWMAGRKEPPLVRVGLDEKWLGRRHGRDEKFVTIVSNLDTGEPIWIGYGRGEATVKSWLDTLSREQKQQLRLVAMDMHAPFLAAIRGDADLAHVVAVHDSFHIMKRAGKAIDELRREAFFRASPELRAVGRGKRWLVLRAWERCSKDQQAQLRTLFSYNRQLGRAYQVVEEIARSPPRTQRRGDHPRVAPHPAADPGAQDQAPPVVARVDPRPLERDRRHRGAQAPHGPHRGAEQQLGDVGAPRPRLPQSRLPPPQAAIHGRESDPEPSKRGPIPRPGFAHSSRSRRVITLARLVVKSGKSAALALMCSNCALRSGWPAPSVLLRTDRRL